MLTATIDAIIAAIFDSWLLVLALVALAGWIDRRRT